MGNKDVGVRTSRTPSWVVNTLAIIFCGPVAFHEVIKSRNDHRGNEALALYIFGGLSCLAWLSAFLTAIGVLPISIFGSTLLAAVAMWAASFVFTVIVIYCFFIFSLPEEEEDGYGYFSGHSDMSDQSGYPNDQAERLRREAGFSRRARAEAAFYNGASGSQAAS
jgi:hypothetical protein